MNNQPTFPCGRRLGILVVGLAWVAAMLACALPGIPGGAGKVTPVPPTADISVQQTSQALEIQATVLAIKDATLQAGAAQATADASAAANAAATAAAVPPTATNPPAATATEPAPPPTAPPPPEPTREQPTAPPEPSPTADMEAQLKKSKILLFEDTPTLGLWIKQALDSGGYKYTNVGDAVGTFMENLNSGIAWDLIIIGAELKAGVRGEFWDVIQEQANRNVAIIAEVWYLDKTINGRIQPFLTACGIDYQRDQPQADSLYWLEPTHPVFNSPNTAMPLLHYSRYWAAQSGDLIKLLPGSDATLLAGIQKSRNSDYGQIATCMDGRVIFQTFSNHDYPRKDILQLWQNYVDYTLRNHYQATE